VHLFDKRHREREEEKKRKSITYCRFFYSNGRHEIVIEGIFIFFSFYDSLFLSHLNEEKKKKEMPIDFVCSFFLFFSSSHDDST
jgi:hypothetical protein